MLRLLQILPPDEIGTLQVICKVCFGSENKKIRYLLKKIRFFFLQGSAVLSPTWSDIQRPLASWRNDGKYCSKNFMFATVYLFVLNRQQRRLEFSIATFKTCREELLNFEALAISRMRVMRNMCIVRSTCQFPQRQVRKRKGCFVWDVLHLFWKSGWLCLPILFLIVFARLQTCLTRCRLERL